MRALDAMQQRVVVDSWLEWKSLTCTRVQCLIHSWTATWNQGEEANSGGRGCLGLDEDTGEPRRTHHPSDLPREQRREQRAQRPETHDTGGRASCLRTLADVSGFARQSHWPFAVIALRLADSRIARLIAWWPA